MLHLRYATIILYSQYVLQYIFKKKKKQSIVSAINSIEFRMDAKHSCDLSWETWHYYQHQIFHIAPTHTVMQFDQFHFRNKHQEIKKPIWQSRKLFTFSCIVFFCLHCFHLVSGYPIGVHWRWPLRHLPVTLWLNWKQKTWIYRV